MRKGWREEREREGGRRNREGTKGGGRMREIGREGRRREG